MNVVLPWAEPFSCGYHDPNVVDEIPITRDLDTVFLISVGPAPHVAERIRLGLEHVEVHDALIGRDLKRDGRSSFVSHDIEFLTLPVPQLPAIHGLGFVALVNESVARGIEFTEGGMLWALSPHVDQR